MTQPLAIVAGVGPGLGVAIARRFASESFRLALLARDAGRLDRLAAPLRAGGAVASVHPADLSDHGDTARALGGIVAEHGRPSVLVWNAAIWSEAPPLDLAPEEFDRQFRLGLSAALTSIQVIAPSMRVSGGSILLTGGGLALAPEYGGAVPALTAVKSALRGFVHAAAPDFAAKNLRLATVTVAGQITPGSPFDPDRIAEAFWQAHADPQPRVEIVFDGKEGKS
jgi:NAD(P)-dependent dehydrogenase (short-subunit alcohol dehydrogenase family)